MGPVPWVVVWCSHGNHRPALINHRSKVGSG